MTLADAPFLHLAFVSLHLVVGHFGSALLYFARYGRNPLVLYRASRTPHALATRAMALLSLAWTVALIVSAFSPWFSRTLVGRALFSVPASVSFGAATLGLVIMAVSQASMGAAFRVGQHDRDAPEALQTSHVHKLSRNPIYVGSWLALFGMTLFHPSALQLLLVVLLARGIHSLVLAEEAFLTERFGPAYLAYREATPRYVGIRRGARS